MNSPDILLHDELFSSLLEVDRVRFRESFGKVLYKYPPSEALDSFIVPILNEIGNGWFDGMYSLSQLYMGGRICEEVIPSLLESKKIPKKNKVPMAIAVLQDHHILGKKIVYLVLRSTGYHLIDYGSVQTPEELVERVLNDGIRILLISVLMLPSALLIKEVRRLLNESGVSVKIVVGGAPFNFDSKLWKEVGADSMRQCATQVVPLLADLLKDIPDE